MRNRTGLLVVCLSILPSAVFAQAVHGVGYVVEFGTAASASGKFQVFPENASTFASSSIGNTGPAAPSQIVAKPDGSKFYMVGENTLADVNPNFSTVNGVNGLTGTFSSAVISPNGNYLLLASAQTSSSGALYVINTSNDAVALNVPIAGAIIGMVISQDSSTAWILGESLQTFITTISLTGTSATGTPSQTGSSIFLRDPTSGQSVAGDATSFSMSPLGDLYVTAGNEVLQIDPAVLAACQTNPNCAPSTIIQVNAKPGPLQYTFIPNSTGNQLYAYFVNQTPSIGGRSIYRIPIPWVSGDSPVSFSSSEKFDSLLIAGPQRMLAHSAVDSTLWDVAPDLSSVTVSSLQSVLPATQTYAIAISGELPSAQFLYAVSGTGSLADVYLVSLSSNSVLAQTASPLGLGYLQFVYVPSESPAGFTNPPLTYNSNQTNLAPGSTALPLIAKILDQAGNPVYGVPVTFTGDSSLTIVPATTTTTNGNGFVQASVTVGADPGSYPVTMTVGSGGNSASTTFSLTIPGGSPGTGSSGAGPMSIVAGNGQLFEAGQSHVSDPNGVLTVLLVDTNGNPLVGQPVSFAVTGPQIGTVDTVNATTDAMGLATTNFFPGNPDSGLISQATTVTANTVQGSQAFSVTFTETIFPPETTPSITIQQPSASTLQGGEGDVLPQAIVALISAKEVISVGAHGPSAPLPNIGIRIADPNNSNLNGPGWCQGNPLSDQNGIINCNFVPACAATIGGNGLPVGLGSHGFSIDVGEFGVASGYAIDITPGVTQTLSINSGNNQSGTPGATLPRPLTALTTDQCGTPIPGVTVTWHVTRGSATLSSPTGVSGANGEVSTNVTLGSIPGPVTITATINGITSITFTEISASVVGSLNLVSGGGQSAVVGVAFPQPLVFQVKDANGNPISGLTINFSVSSGSASAPGPVIQPGGVVPVGSTVNTIQPGEWVSIFGSNFASSPAMWNGTFTESLGGASVTINGKAAYLSFINATQINLQAPDDTSTGPVPVVVTTASGTATSTVTLAPFAPSFLVLDSTHVAGIIPRSNGSGAYGGGTYDILGPTGNSLGYPTVSAKPGDTVELFAVGLGPTNEAVPAGQAFSGAEPTTDPVTVLVNNVSVAPAFAGLTGAGLYQVNLTVPAGLGNGDLPLVARVGGAQTPPTVVISVGTPTAAATGSLTLLTSASQTALVDTQFSAPPVFQRGASNNNPQAGATANSTVASGTAAISTASAVTNSQGQASVSVTAGSKPGPVTITATYSTFTASATLTVVAPGPSVTASSFVNAASLQQGLVPCGLATVTGAGLAAGVNGVVPGNALGVGPLPYTLEGVSISVNAIPAPVSSVSNENGVQQVNFQTPCQLTTGVNATVVVQVNSATTTVPNVPVFAAQPGIFTYAGPNGINYGAVTSVADGSNITPFNLAHAGQTYFLVATGLGQTTPSATTNSPGTGSQIIPASQVVLAIDNIGVPVSSAQYQEGAIGEYAITFTIPTAVNGQPFPTGTNFPLTLGIVTANGQTVFDPSLVALPGIQ